MPDTPKLKELKSRSQKLKPVVRLGKQGLTAAFWASLEQALNDHELVKVKLEEFKEQKKEMARAMVEKTGALLVQQVGHVVVLYRKKPEPSEGAP